MKRQIIFRGKRIDNGEWIEGDLCNFFTNGKCIMPRSYYATREFDEPEEGEMPKLEDGFAIGEWFTVHPETVGQYTGLKDKNGKMIFEGDVIKVESIHSFNSDLLEEFRNENHLETINGIGSFFSGIIRMDSLRGLMYENPKNGYQEPITTRHRKIRINLSGIEITGNIHDNGQ